MIELCAVGGYCEVGRNMSAVKVDDEVIILDMGLHIDNFIKYTSDEDAYDISPKALTKANAIPNINVIKKWKNKVKAIVCSHAHLDHVGAVPYLSNKFEADIIGTPYTIEVIKDISKKERITLRNDLITVNPNSTIKISKNIKIEFINITHSVPQTVVIVIHTKYGLIVYANDFKLDNLPVLGKKPNYKRLGQLKNENVLALVMDSLYVSRDGRTPSESVAREMLKDVMFGITNKKFIVVTTFSSHLARLKSIVGFGKQLNRKIIFMGRSLGRYVQAGENAKIINFQKDIELLRYPKQIKKRMNKITRKSRDKYMFVVTGHQGEHKAILPRIVKRDIDFNLEKGDNVIFSCTTIPNPANIKDRQLLEKRLKKLGTRLYLDVHVSGHGSKEDIRDMIEMIAPKYIIPTHGSREQVMPILKLAGEIGFNKSNIYILKNSQIINIG